jgi:hypothetical protein
MPRERRLFGFSQYQQAVEGRKMEIIPLIVALTLFILFMVCVAWGKQDNESFERRFPPISDAEFVARCTPGIDPAVALRVRRIVADRLGVEYERIHPATRFVEDLGVD